MQINALNSLVFFLTKMDNFFTSLFFLFPIFLPIILALVFYVLYVNNKFSPKKYERYTERFDIIFNKSQSAKQSKFFRNKNIRQRRIDYFFVIISAILSIMSVIVLSVLFFIWLSDTPFSDWFYDLNPLIYSLFFMIFALIFIMIAIVVGVILLLLYNLIISKIVYTIIGKLKRYISIANIKERRR